MSSECNSGSGSISGSNSGSSSNYPHNEILRDIAALLFAVKWMATDSSPVPPTPAELDAGWIIIESLVRIVETEYISRLGEFEHMETLEEILRLDSPTSQFRMAEAQVSSLDIGDDKQRTAAESFIALARICKTALYSSGGTLNAQLNQAEKEDLQPARETTTEMENNSTDPELYSSLFRLLLPKFRTCIGLVTTLQSEGQEPNLQTVWFAFGSAFVSVSAQMGFITLIIIQIVRALAAYNGLQTRSELATIALSVLEQSPNSAMTASLGRLRDWIDGLATEGVHGSKHL